MKILGLLLCLISIFILSKRLTLFLFGTKAQGYIIGYGNKINGLNGIVSYSYKVKYKYQNREYIANSIESLSVLEGSITNKNLNKNIIVYFNKNKPEIVTIKEFKGTTITGVIFLIIGLISVII